MIISLSPFEKKVLIWVAVSQYLRSPVKQYYSWVTIEGNFGTTLFAAGNCRSLKSLGILRLELCHVTKKGEKSKKEQEAKYVWMLTTKGKAEVLKIIVGMLSMVLPKNIR